MQFSDQGKFKGSVQLLNFEGYFPVGDHEDVREVPDDSTLVVPRSLQITTEGIEVGKEILIKHVSETESVCHSFDDGWGLLGKVWCARRRRNIMVDICGLGVCGGLDLGDDDAVIQLLHVD